MSWITPKTDWTSADGVDFNDLNRIEGDIAFIATNPSGTNLQLAPDGGFVAIGNNDPSGQLDVGGVNPTSSDIIDAVGKMGVGGSTGGRLLVEGSVTADIILDDSGATVDEKMMQFVNSGGITQFRTLTDVGGVAQNNIIVIDNSDGAVMINTSTSTGENFQVNGSARFTGTTNNVIIDSIGKLTTGGDIQANNITVAIALAAGDVNAVNNIFFPAFGNVGTVLTAASSAHAVSTAYAAGTSVAGNTLYVSSDTASNDASLSARSGAGMIISNTAWTNLGLTGTWRLLSRVYRGPTATTYPVGLFQRIS